ncbi:MAG: glycosyltransferase involved in cell wall biosynthesis [Planctomycetota bacterium]|jgi:glycosyltransferase involved in cell wall biosynthesis
MNRTPEPSLRIALVMKQLASRRMSAEHARILQRELLGHGHVVRRFGAWGKPRPDSGSKVTNPLHVHEADPELADFDPQAIVVYDAATPAALTGARQAARLNVPLFLIQEGLPHETPHIERWFRRFGHNVWGALLRRNCTRIIALDPVAKDSLIRRGYSPEAIEVVPPGIDLAQYRPGLWSHLPTQHGIRGRMLLHIGKINFGLGLEELVAAFAQTVGRRRDWALVLAGEGEAQSTLQSQVTRLGIGSQVHFLSEPSEEELPGLLGSSTLFAAPRGDAGAGDLIERRALACGLPVLSSERPGVRHFLEDDGCGRLAPAGDAEAWAEMIQLAASSPERRRRWSLRAREIAEQCFAWPHIGNRIAAILGEMILDHAEAQREPDGFPKPEPR